MRHTINGRLYIGIYEHKKDIYRLSALYKFANTREQEFIKGMMYSYKSSIREDDETQLTIKQSRFIVELVNKLEAIFNRTKYHERPKTTNSITIVSG